MAGTEAKEGTTLHSRACPLCEAICGLVIETRGGAIVSIRGDEKDPFSRGHICPKAVALQDIHNDPDRLRKPVRKVGGTWQEIEWDEAIDLTAKRLAEIRAEHGPQSIGVYQGNPNVHNWGMMTHSGNFLGLLKTRNRFSATSVDQLPMQLVAYWMFGHQLLITIPDIDHTDYFLMLGANPLASNGSLMTVPDVAKRIKALQERGGKLVVIDPRRTETAKVADTHLFIRPEGDTAFLFALINTIVQEDLRRTDRLGPMSKNLDLALQSIAPMTAERAATLCGIPAEVIKQTARDFAAADKAVAYGRMGACAQRNGTLAQWAVQLLNLITGNTDKVGGSLVSNPALDLIAAPNSKPGGYGRWHSRVRGLPEALGEFPSALMAEEIQTPGEGQIRAMVTVAGNPVLSTPNGQQLDKALESLDFMVSIDLYINETSRHADLILPTTGPLEHDHYDLIFNIFGVRNQAKYSASTFEKPAESLHDWELFDKLANAFGQLTGNTPRPAMPPQMVLDFGLQMGPYGSASEHKLSLEKLKAHPEGIDLGALRPSFPQRLCTQDKRIDAAPEALLAGVKDYLVTALAREAVEYPFSLIGRRHVRSNNSWMHNSERLVKGRNRCTVMMNSGDATRLGFEDGQQVAVQSRVGSLQLQLEMTDDLMPGVVSIPHGWGHDRPGIRQRIATEHAGVSCNDLTDDRWLDAISGNAAVNGVPVNVVSGLFDNHAAN